MPLFNQLQKPIEATYAGPITRVFQRGANTFQDLVMQGEIPMFGSATPLASFLTGNTLELEDEEGAARLSPFGQFDLAGKYGSVGFNPYQRQMSASFRNPQNNFAVQGQVGLGPPGYDNLSAQIGFSLGNPQMPVMVPNRIPISGLPPEDAAPPMSEARAFAENKITNFYDRKRLANPNFYTGITTAPPPL